MTKEEVIAKAQQDYPVGSVVKSMTERYIEKVVSNKPLWTSPTEIWFECEHHNIRLYTAAGGFGGSIIPVFN